MWRTGLRGSIYEVQRECLSWWVMDSKLITPPPPVFHSEQKPLRGHKSMGLVHSAQHKHTQQQQQQVTLHGPQALVCMHQLSELSKMYNLWIFTALIDEVSASWNYIYIFSGNTSAAWLLLRGNVHLHGWNATTQFWIVSPTRSYVEVRHGLRLSLR